MGATTASVRLFFLSRFMGGGGSLRLRPLTILFVAVSFVMLLLLLLMDAISDMSESVTDQRLWNEGRDVCWGVQGPSEDRAGVGSSVE